MVRATDDGRTGTTSLRVGVVDSGLCNLGSVMHAVRCLGAEPVRLEGPAGIAACDKLLLPGVGTFGQGMENLGRRGFVGPLEEAVLGRGTAILGICLGMQLFASLGTEKGTFPGLGWIPGRVERLRTDLRLPHMGWNEVRFRAETPLRQEAIDGADFYFVHSYAFGCDDPGHMAATTVYGAAFASVVRRDNIHGVQFHPEKSHRAGLHLLHRFLYADRDSVDVGSGPVVEQVLTNALSDDRKVHGPRRLPGP
ncbi:imidazole glycerol phosphate synthase, glutamine amidotransferase subunit (plasmid) [Solidesulfovibrio carbinoliphilus subsp. oakridgensis]|uniref:Imidazole glycerol phosphate synthase subunit HisH n=1 Tax=Solidesulfovibrio carbinoliphilus subsp. oakridgensis TaxID=694327 RepID=G7QE74_9BACT|nr:imidazole glycerol phosphate synthase subunit HisH [Solidesulfovibrio carbinoliphilus]EHJ45968.1 imidazole glycerol phosphate synthase, glutamine amidotransferase subunit [Solidesulfovibrio carbinoliphilus subsp. oakridgensis]